ncbi:MAG: YARHG domain-containing protein [Saprospiraceae bacterium]
MKKLFIYTFLLGILAACGSGETATEQTQTEQQTEQQTEEQVVEIPKNQQGMYGYYVGMFEAEEFKRDKKPSYSNKINIAIDKIEDGKIEGHSVIAGNSRPFSGTITDKGNNIYEVEAKEPGDDRYDGTFSFTIDAEKEDIQGFWMANDKKLAVTKRKYDLNKKVFTYQKDLELEESVLLEAFYDTYDDEQGTFEIPTEQSILINASNTELKPEDVENLFKGDLEIIRNAIYARHGYTFKYRRMRYIFDKISWYIPVHTEVKDMLTDLEKKNIDLLKRYEKHSEAYYDAYGR